MSSAQVSEASIQPSPSRPSTSGRTPSGSRQPISWVSVMQTMAKAPSTRRSASFMRSAMVRWKPRAIRCTTASVSEEELNTDPRSISSRRIERALVRLPLWASAIEPMARSARNGCTSRRAVAPLPPAVE